MPDNLLPCPFCGASFKERHKEGCFIPLALESVYNTASNYRIQIPTKEELDKAWNTRAERTCEWMRDEDGIYHGACGIDWEFTYGDIEENRLNFCPNCGAKVVE